MKNRILYIFFLFVTTVFAVRCAVGLSESILDSDGHENLLLVGGSVYSKEEPDKPIMGIKIVLSSYLKYDPVNEGPIESMIVYSTSDGMFRFQWPNFSDKYIYMLEAEDVDGQENGGEYKSDRIEINLLKDSPSYDKSTSTYKVEGNFFYLEKK